MAKWKLCRQTFGSEVFTFSEGEEVSLGRGLNNTITLSSLVISRSHCLINFQRNQILITDLNSSNGIYVGTKRIPANIPYEVKESDVIGIGWTIDVPLGKILDNEKFIFKVVKEPLSLINRITFQSDDEFDSIEEKIASLSGDKTNNETNLEVSPNKTKLQLKRKIHFENEPLPRIIDNIKIKCESDIKKEHHDMLNDNEQIICILSDSDTELNSKPETISKKPKLETVHEELQKDTCRSKDEISLKTENEYLEFEAFNVKQEYERGYYDEAIEIDSDSDSESGHWYLRLSQSSPGKPFMKVQDKITDAKPEDSSYSQMDDDLDCNAFLHDNDYLDDASTMPAQPQDEDENENFELEIAAEKKLVIESVQQNNNITDCEEKVPDSHLKIPHISDKDEIDGFSSKEGIQLPTTTVANLEPPVGKKAQMIEPLHQSKKKTNQTIIKTSHSTNESKSKRSSKNDKRSKQSSKTEISNSQKEERKRKLKEIAQKGSEKLTTSSSKTDKHNSSKSKTHVKVTSSNRQAFLTDEPLVKPVKRKESPPNSKTEKTKKGSVSPENLNKSKSPEQSNDIENDKNTHSKTEKKEQKHDNRSTSECSLSNVKCNGISNTSPSELRIPLKSLKPLTEKDISKEQLSHKKKKLAVRFSEAPPEVHYFEIEAGNKMKKTSLVKTTLVDSRKMPSFSLERITLMKILRWNPHWLEEQINNNEPPPILGHNQPLALFHSFSSHNQYVQLIGDLLLMEIWECLSIAYMKLRNQSIGLRMVIASLPPMPTQERLFDTFNISVDVSLPTAEIRNLPRVGDILLVKFGPESLQHQRFFFVHNVRNLPSPPSNRNSFFSISLQATFSDKMRLLKPGEVMVGISLAYINKELSLFESMAYMAGSPLRDVILKPEPRHFMMSHNPPPSITNPWTMTLNSSQHAAVASSVSAALGDRPCIQMVQGPPGTGKSSVICAIVMSYFYDANGKKQQHRGKILICATSNAAVDELVIRLLNIRQTLPTSERFRMVRVGRAEAMHPRAREVSSQQLAQRDAARLHDPQHRHGLNQEIKSQISHLEAKINMWKTAVQDATAKGQDPMRVAYCQGRITELYKRIALLRGGGGDELRPEQLVHAEKRYIEGADIVVTTLSSAHNHKMKGLKRRIALCIVDEAGQAIEPEALIPLTLDVTRLTLIGDPQQLPGYICSQRAKKHGLGESLFSRLASCAELWREGTPVILLHEQYRMHEHIADYPNRAFYANQIRTVPRARPELPVPPYCIIGISSGDKGQNAAGANEMEAWGVARLAAALGAGLRARHLSLAVITPYNAHKDLIKRNLKMLQDPAEAQTEVNTVDSFQGQERDVVLVSLARSSGVGFLTDAGRMNVMLTRARHALLVCLNPHAVLKNHQWRTLLEDAQRRKLYRTLPYKVCQPSSLISNEDILKHV